MCSERGEGACHLVRHNWRSDSEEYSHCVRCGLTVKAYRIKKGNLPTCEQVFSEKKRQIKLNHTPPCLDPELNLKPMVACFNCPGNIDLKKCESLRRMGGYERMIAAQMAQRLNVKQGRNKGN